MTIKSNNHKESVPAGSGTTSDLFLEKARNLGDISDAETARDNIDVYSETEIKEFSYMGVNDNQGVLIQSSTYDYVLDCVQPDDDTLIIFYREGTNHVTDDSDYSKINAVKYTISTNTFGTPWLVYQDADTLLYAHNPKAGIDWVNQKIIVAFSRIRKDYGSGTAAISGVNDAGGGEITVLTSNTTGLADGDRVVISGTTNYNDCFIISNLVANTSFVVTDTYVSSQTGTWTKTGSFEDISCVISTDLTGTSWGSPITIVDNLTDPCYAGINPSGGIVVNDAGNIILPWFSHKLPLTVYKLLLARSTNYGASWTAEWVEVYSGSNFYGEAEVRSIGGNRFILLCRNNTSTYEPGMAISNDGCATWDTVEPTNIISSGQSLIYFYVDNDAKTIIYILLDRGGTGKLSIGECDIGQVWTDKEAFNPMDEINSGFTYDGYAIIRKIGVGRYFVAYSERQSSADSDITGFIYVSKRFR